MSIMSGWIAAADADLRVEYLVRIVHGGRRTTTVSRRAGNWEWRDLDGKRIAWIYPDTQLLPIPDQADESTSEPVTAGPPGTDRWILTLAGRHYVLDPDHLSGPQDLTVLLGLLARAFAAGHEVEETEPGEFLVLAACEPRISVGRVRRGRAVAGEWTCSRCGIFHAKSADEKIAGLCSECLALTRVSDATRRSLGYNHQYTLNK